MDFASLKKSYKKTDWWPYLSLEVQQAFENLIDQLNELGLTFRDAYISLFKLEHKKRLLAGVAKSSSEPSPFFGKLMPEECYHSGIEPLKYLFNLPSWVQPNDVDVNAVMILCQQLDVLETAGILKPDSETKETPFPEISDMDYL